MQMSILLPSIRPTGRNDESSAKALWMKSSTLVLITIEYVDLWCSMCGQKISTVPLWSRISSAVNCLSIGQSPEEAGVGVLLAEFAFPTLPADVDKITVPLGFCNNSWDLVGEVDALKIDERVAGFHILSLDDCKGFAQDFLGKGTFDHPETGVVVHALSFQRTTGLD
jgi:hypothetical protein